jgi:putative glutamine transport system substrate-binding protein
MKHHYLFTLLLPVLLLLNTQLYGQQLKGDTWAQVQNRKSGTIVLTYTETPSIAFKDIAGRPAGICVDIMTNFISYVERTRGVKLNVSYQGKTDDFVAFYNNVKSGSGGVFGMANVTVLESRKKEIKYTPSFMNNIMVVLTHTSVPTLSKMDRIGYDFKGMTAYTVRNTTNATALMEIKNKYMPDLKIVYVNSFPDVLERISNDPKSFAPIDFNFYNDALAKRLPIKRHPAGDNVNEEFAMIMPMDTDWAPLIEEYFRQFGTISQNPEYKKSLTKHLGVNAARMLESVAKKTSN